MLYHTIFLSYTTIMRSKHRHAIETHLLQHDILRAKAHCQGGAVQVLEDVVMIWESFQRRKPWKIMVI